MNISYIRENKNAVHDVSLAHDSVITSRISHLIYMLKTNNNMYIRYIQYVYVYIYMYIYMYMYTYMYTRVCICICVCMCIYKCIYIYTSRKSMKLDIHTSHNMISSSQNFKASSFQLQGFERLSEVDLMMRSWDILGRFHGRFHGIHTLGFWKF